MESEEKNRGTKAGKNDLLREIVSIGSNPLEAIDQVLQTCLYTVRVEGIQCNYRGHAEDEIRSTLTGITSL